MATVTTTGARAHVTNMEREIQTIKGTYRCIVPKLFRVKIKVLTKQVIIHLI